MNPSEELAARAREARLDFERRFRRIDPPPIPRRSCPWCGSDRVRASGNCREHDDLEQSYTDSAKGGSLPDSVSLIVSDVPADLKALIAAAVEERETNMNDLVVGLLADRYGVGFEPSGRKSSVGKSPTLVLKVPEELRFAIRVRATEQRSNARALILDALREDLTSRAAA